MIGCDRPNLLSVCIWAKSGYCQLSKFYHILVKCTVLCIIRLVHIYVDACVSLTVDRMYAAIEKLAAQIEKEAQKGNDVESECI